MQLEAVVRQGWQITSMDIKKQPALRGKQLVFRGLALTPIFRSVSPFCCAARLIRSSGRLRSQLHDDASFVQLGDWLNRVTKRDGSITEFHIAKIGNAITRALRPLAGSSIRA